MQIAGVDGDGIAATGDRLKVCCKRGGEWTAARRYRTDSEASDDRDGADAAAALVDGAERLDVALLEQPPCMHGGTWKLQLHACTRSTRSPKVGLVCYTPSTAHAT